MNTQKHTPWKLWNGYGPLPDGRYAVSRIGPDGMYNGLVGSEGHDIIGTQDDLEYVVTCYNSHNALLAVLKEVEFVGKRPGFWGLCPWCNGLDGPIELNGKHGLADDHYGHKAACMRQAAIAAAGEVKP